MSTWDHIQSAAQAKNLGLLKEALAEYELRKTLAPVTVWGFYPSWPDLDPPKKTYEHLSNAIPFSPKPKGPLVAWEKVGDTLRPSQTWANPWPQLQKALMPLREALLPFWLTLCQRHNLPSYQDEILAFWRDFDINQDPYPDRAQNSLQKTLRDYLLSFPALANSSSVDIDRLLEASRLMLSTSVWRVLNSYARLVHFSPEYFAHLRDGHTCGPEEPCPVNEIRLRALSAYLEASLLDPPTAPQLLTPSLTDLSCAPLSYGHPPSATSTPSPKKSPFHPGEVI